MAVSQQRFFFFFFLNVLTPNQTHAFKFNKHALKKLDVLPLNFHHYRVGPKSDWPPLSLLTAIFEKLFFLATPAQKKFASRGEGLKILRFGEMNNT